MTPQTLEKMARNARDSGWTREHWLQKLMIPLDDAGRALVDRVFAEPAAPPAAPRASVPLPAPAPRPFVSKTPAADRGVQAFVERQTERSAEKKTKALADAADPVADAQAEADQAKSDKIAQTAKATADHTAAVKDYDDAKLALKVAKADSTKSKVDVAVAETALEAARTKRDNARVAKSDVVAKTADRVATAQTKLADAKKLDRAERKEIARGSICLDGGNLHENVKQAVHTLRQLNAPLFQWGLGLLVQPVVLQQPMTLADEQDQDGKPMVLRPGTLILQEHTPASLRVLLSEYLTFTVSTAEGKKRVDPPKEFAEAILAAKQVWKDCLPTLEGITPIPQVREDGSLLLEPGYDPATELWYDPGNLRLPPIPDQPTRDDALRAFNVLMRPFREYDMDAVSRSVLAAALLTCTVVRVIGVVPSFACTAVLPGYGKTKLWLCVLALCTGNDGPVSPYPTNEEERGKGVAARLRKGRMVLLFSNATAPIGGSMLNDIATGKAVEFRILGESTEVEVSAKVLMLFEGNNLSVEADMSRRVLLVTLKDQGVPRPENRSFDFDPVEETKEGRGGMIAHALTIMRAYEVAKRPQKAGTKPLGSYERWDRVRQALLWLGQPDPFDSQVQVRKNDPAGEAKRILLRLLPATDFKVADLRAKCLSLTEAGGVTDLGAELLVDGQWNRQKVTGRIKVLMAPVEMEDGTMWRVEEVGKDTHAETTVYRVLKDVKA